jgi:hypothetical protein
MQFLLNRSTMVDPGDFPSTVGLIGIGIL